MPLGELLAPPIDNVMLPNVIEVEQPLVHCELPLVLRWSISSVYITPESSVKPSPAIIYGLVTHVPLPPNDFCAQIFAGIDPINNISQQLHDDCVLVQHECAFLRANNQKKIKNKQTNRDSFAKETKMKSAKTASSIIECIEHYKTQIQQKKIATKFNQCTSAASVTIFTHLHELIHEM